jgi:F-type H+-transporting ATPase subunit delta
MSSGIARKYAKALYTSLLQDKEAQLAFANESLAIGQAFGNDRIKSVFGNPVLPDSVKRELVDAVLEAMGVGVFLKRFCRGVAMANRSAFIAQIMSETRKMLAAASGVVEVKITSAKSLSEVQEKNIQAMLAKATNATVIIENDVDPAILGGVVLTMGNNRLDLSLRKKIKEFERSAIN